MRVLSKFSDVSRGANRLVRQQASFAGRFCGGSRLSDCESSLDFSVDFSELAVIFFVPNDAID